MKKYAIIGAAGYVAPRHMRAIQETGGILVAALDPHDSVGILDSYFPDCHYFREFERFDRHLSKIQREGNKIDYLVICSPNYLHDAHCRYGINNQMDVICEKPLALKSWNVDALKEMTSQSKHSIYPVMQLRLHHEIQLLKNKISTEDVNAPRHQVKLEYNTSRGNWYHHSWKGNEQKSGGLLMNIGVHFFDMLLWIFGPCQSHDLKIKNHTSASGTLQLEKANVQWSLSIEKNTTRKRALLIDNVEIDFTMGFENLHTDWYRHVLKGNVPGTDLNEINQSIKLINDLSS